MAAKQVRCVPDLPGINKMMTCTELREFMQAAGESVVGHASNLAGGAAFVSRTNVTSRKWIAITSIHPDDNEARQANLDDNVLLKALNSAGLHMSKGE